MYVSKKLVMNSPSIPTFLVIREGPLGLGVISRPVSRGNRYLLETEKLFFASKFVKPAVYAMKIKKTI